MQCVHAKSLRSRPTLWDSMDCSPPGSSVHGLLQAGILEWVPCPPPWDLPDPGIELVSSVAPALQADSLPLSHREAPEQWWEVPSSHGLWSHLSNLGTKVPSWGSLPPQHSPAPTSDPQSGQGGPLWPPPGIAGHRGRAGPLPYRPAPANPRTSLAGSVPMG